MPLPETYKMGDRESTYNLVHTSHFSSEWWRRLREPCHPPRGLDCGTHSSSAKNNTQDLSSRTIEDSRRLRHVVLVDVRDRRERGGETTKKLLSGEPRTRRVFRCPTYRASSIYLCVRAEIDSRSLVRQTHTRVRLSCNGCRRNGWLSVINSYK